MRLPLVSFYLVRRPQFLFPILLELPECRLERLAIWIHTTLAGFSREGSGPSRIRTSFGMKSQLDGFAVGEPWPVLVAILQAFHVQRYTRSVPSNLAEPKAADALRLVRKENEGLLLAFAAEEPSTAWMVDDDAIIDCSSSANGLVERNRGHWF